MVGLNLQQAAAPQRRAVADPDIALLRALEGQSSAPLTTAYSFNLTGVLSEAAATWGRRMALARVQPAMPALDANLLWRAAWGLAFYGEHVEIIDVRDGRLVLTPSYYFEVDGFGMDPNGWVYQADMSSPDQHAQRTVRGAGVLHFRLPGPEPWRGQHTLEKAVEFKALVAQLERAMVDEAGTPVKRIVPDRGGVDAGNPRRAAKRPPRPAQAHHLASDDDGRRGRGAGYGSAHRLEAADVAA